MNHQFFSQLVLPEVLVYHAGPLLKNGKEDTSNNIVADNRIGHRIQCKNKVRMFSFPLLQI